MKNNSKNKKSKIPLCPQKNKLIKKNINKKMPFLSHFRQPSMPSSTTSNNININSFNMININKYNHSKNISDSSLKKSPFHAFIPKNKSFSGKTLKKQRVILIKNINKGNKLSFNFNNIKEYIFKKKEKKECRNDININKEKENSDLNNSHNTKTNTNSNTTIGISPTFSDRDLKEDNNKLIQFPKNLRNPLEFTFGDTNFLNKQLEYEAKRSLIKNNSFDLNSISQLSIENNYNNTYQSTDKKNYNYNNKLLLKNTNLKLIINKKRKEKRDYILQYNSHNNENCSIEANNKKKELNKISKSITLHKCPKLNPYKNFNIDRIHKTPKVSKKIVKLIPVDKKYNLNKKYKLIIKNQSEYKDNINFKPPISTKIKDSKSNSYKLLIKAKANSVLAKTNKSSPKLFLKHPSLKNLFES